MFTKIIFGILLVIGCSSTVFVVQALVVPPSHIHNDVVDQYEQDVSQMIDRSDLLFKPFNSLTLLKDIATHELESNYYRAIDFEKVNNSTIECITEQAIILREAIETAQQHLRVCLEDGAGRYAEAIHEVEKVKEQIRIQIVAGKEVVRNCTDENPGDVIAIVKCIEEKGQPVREALIQLVKELGEKIQKAEEAIGAIIEDTKQCIRKVAEEAKVVIQAIIAEIKQCLA